MFISMTIEGAARRANRAPQRDGSLFKGDVGIGLVTAEIGGREMGRFPVFGL